MPNAAAASLDPVLIFRVHNYEHQYRPYTFYVFRRRLASIYKVYQNQRKRD